MKDVVDIAKDATVALAKVVKTVKGRNAAKRAFQHLLAGGSERDPQFLDDVRAIEVAETSGKPAELVRRAVRPAAKKAAPKKPAPKKPALKKAAAKMPSPKKTTTKKPAVKKDASK